MSKPTAQVQPENFEPEVRRLFGDLRLKHIWEMAYSHFFVSWIFDCICDGESAMHPFVEAVSKPNAAVMALEQYNYPLASQA
ncbi:MULTISPECIES: hypothetical protein [Cyanophyceae]|uniref:hypothetical protein n=1 Tax=Cyanophyceae TaxID=3028117 RepID=UPI001686C1E5|nr:MULTISPECIES: hypothetical protein [Cyanophyceae]MBD1914948.1 hypothetical protein [Phormidium sp. FACHB-77]MBD2028626.1 hypothetical protein [Phormidium sp. FACHB-322]MBD2051730.1 hypothetical protein [Leptolyngbya sp. FACHB-60]